MYYKIMSILHIFIITVLLRGCWTQNDRSDLQLPLSPVWYDNIGVYLESIGLAIHPEDIMTTNFIIYFPPFQTSITSDPDCEHNLRTVLDEMTRKEFDFIETLIYMFSGTNQQILNQQCNNLPPIFCNNHYHDSLHSNRSKRFLPLIALGMGVSGLGLSIYNTITTHHINSAVNALIRNEDTIQNRINEMIDRQNQLIDLGGSVYAKIERLQLETTQKIKEMGCQFSEQIHQIMIKEAIDTQLSRYESILHSIFLGDVTSEIIKPTQLTNLITMNDALKDSIYQDDISLFYRLAKITPVRFSVNTMGISTILSIPVIKKKDISPVYVVHNLGISDLSQGYKRLVLPEHVVFFAYRESFIPVSLDKNTCSISNGIWICSDTNLIIQEADHCLKLIITSNGTIDNKNSDICKLEYITQIKPTVRVYNTGLLTIGYSSYQVNDKIRGHLSLSQPISLNPQKWELIPFESFDQIIVGGRTYNSPSRYTLTTTVKGQYIEMTDNIDLDLKSMNLSTWSSSDEIEQMVNNLKVSKLDHLKLEEISSLPDNTWLIYIIISALAGCIIWNLILTFKIIRIKHQPFHKQVRYINNKNLDEYNRVEL